MTKLNITIQLKSIDLASIYILSQNLQIVLVIISRAHWPTWKRLSHYGKYSLGWYICYFMVHVGYELISVLQQNQRRNVFISLL